MIKISIRKIFARYDDLLSVTAVLTVTVALLSGVFFRHLIDHRPAVHGTQAGQEPLALHLGLYLPQYGHFHGCLATLVPNCFARSWAK